MVMGVSVYSCSVGNEMGLFSEQQFGDVLGHKALGVKCTC